MMKRRTTRRNNNPITPRDPLGTNLFHDMRNRAMCTKADILKSLQGHPHKEEILAILDEPVEVHETFERKSGCVVSCSAPDDPGEAIHTVHMDKHWNAPRTKDLSGKPLGTTFDPVLWSATDARRKTKRARHGLGFLERPHRKGPWNLDRPSSRKKALAAYAEQSAQEAPLRVNACKNNGL